MTSALLVAALSMTLLGCATNSFVTLGDASKSFPRAKCPVYGKTRTDQKWISETIAAEVAGFGFKRPAKCATSAKK